MPDEVQQVEKVETMQGTTVFSIFKPKPLWATWMFRTQFILNKVGVFYLTGTDRVGGAELKEILLIMAAVDLGTWMLANSLGIKKTDLGLPDDK